MLQGCLLDALLGLLIDRVLQDLVLTRSVLCAAQHGSLLVLLGSNIIFRDMSLLGCFLV